MTFETEQAQTQACMRCGAPQEPDARFCAECGQAAAPYGLDALGLASEPIGTPAFAAAPTVTMLPQAVQPVYAVRPRRSRLGLVATVMSLVVLAAALAVLALNDKGTHERLTASRRAYAASQADLTATKQQLADTVTELTGTKTDLETTKAALTSAKDALGVKERDLQGVRNNLADVKTSVTIQAGQIETLKTCLSGVSLALSDYADSDYSGTLAALTAVEVSCNKAYALLD